MPRSTSHGLGTGSNNWDIKSYGWPMEIWAKSVHTYRAQGSDRWVVVSQHYSVNWREAAMLYATTIPVALGVVILFRVSRKQ